MEGGFAIRRHGAGKERYSVSLADAKARLSVLVEQAPAGETICITRRGKAVAQLIAVSSPRQPVDIEMLRAEPMKPRRNLSRRAISVAGCETKIGIDALFGYLTACAALTQEIKDRRWTGVAGGAAARNARDQ